MALDIDQVTQQFGGMAELARTVPELQDFGGTIEELKADAATAASKMGELSSDASAKAKTIQEQAASIDGLNKMVADLKEQLKAAASSTN